MQTPTFSDWLIYMLNNANKESLQIIATITYSIWLARSSLIFKGINIPAREAIDRSVKILHDYQHLCSTDRFNSNKSNSTVSRNNNCWTPPPSNFQKLNVDAHLRGDDGRWGFGLVLRRTDDRCIGAATRVCFGSLDVELAEATGLQEALKYAQDNHLRNIIIELDAEKIVKAYHQKIYPRTKWGQIVKNCARVSNQIENCSVSWVSRKSNQAAHYLARWAILEPNRDWSNNYPSCISQHLQNDMPFVPLISA
jgi:ribonuclease HI